MKRGFTLLELLIVVTIVAIMVGFALPYVQHYMQAKNGSGVAVVSSKSSNIPRTLTNVCFPLTTVETVTHEGCDYILIYSPNGEISLTHKGNCRACLARTSNLPAEAEVK